MKFGMSTNEEKMKPDTEVLNSQSATETIINDWTVLLYICTDNDVSGIGDKIIEQIENVSCKTDKLTLVYFHDTNSESEPSKTEYGLIKLDLRNKIFLDEKNYTLPDTLTAFLNWGFQNAAANKYGLIFFGHGQQWQRFSPDITGGDTRISALRKGITDSQIKKFEFIGFDACLMGGIEILTYFKDQTNIFIANPEISFGVSWNYQHFFEYLSRSKQPQNIVEIGKEENRIWEINNSKNDFFDYLAHSVFSTNFTLSDFETNLNNFLSNLDPIKDFLTILLNLPNLVYYGNLSYIKTKKVNSKQLETGYTYFVDFYLFLSIFIKNQHAKILIDQIEKSFLASTVGKNKKRAHIPISIWFPTGYIYQNIIEDYKKYFFQSWINFLDSFRNYLSEKPTSLKLSLVRDYEEKIFIEINDGYIDKTYAFFRDENLYYGAKITQSENYYLNLKNQYQYLIFDTKIPLYHRNVSDNFLYTKCFVKTNKGEKFYFYLIVNEVDFDLKINGIFSDIFYTRMDFDIIEKISDTIYFMFANKSENHQLFFDENQTCATKINISKGGLAGIRIQKREIKIGLNNFFISTLGINGDWITGILKQ